MLDIVERFRRDGTCTQNNVLTADEVDKLRALSEPLLRENNRQRPGVRQALVKEPRIRDVLAGSAARELIRLLCGENARIIRTILFDKTPETNWLVPWHQDATIAVLERVEVSGFGPWSIKDGEVHCRPAKDVLDQIVVVRLHLDDCGPENGPLKVIPRSHLNGLVESSSISEIATRGPVEECCVLAGGAVLMRPHTVHASSKSLMPTRRRVLHIECTSVNLPGGLAWAESVTL